MTAELSAPRSITDAEFDRLLEVDEIAFVGTPATEEQRDVDRSIVDVGRSIGVFDGADLVGGATIFTFAMTAPGARVPLAGVSFVCVLPTHRRRGILKAMMRHQLHGLHEDGGEAIAGLTASEPPIYGRFGYGQATSSAGFAVPRHKNALRLPAGVDEVTLRLVDTRGSVEVCEAIHARQVPKRPGMLERPPAWGRLMGADLEYWRDGRSVRRTVLAERGGEAIGFARYYTKEEWGPRGHEGRVDVAELFADDAAGYAALVRYLTNIDLTGSANFARLATDSEPVLLLADVRAAEVRLGDGLYLRLVDVDRALASRTYSAPLDVVLEVADDFCPWNAGRWHLSWDGKSATCERTTAPAELVLGVRELGSAFLGGVTLRALAAVGLVEERRPGALTEASRAFAADLAPWLNFGF